MSIAEKEIYMDDETDKVKIAILETTAGNINQSLVRLEKRFDKIDFRLDFIESKFDKKFEQIDGRFDEVFRKFMYTDQKLDKKFDELGKEILYLHKENQTQFRWIMGAILGLYGILISLVGKGLFISN